MRDSGERLQLRRDFEGTRALKLFAAVVAAIIGCGASVASVTLLFAPPQASSSTRPSDVFFYVVAGVVIASAAGVALTRHILYAALSLLGTLLGVAALYVYLQADFL